MKKTKFVRLLALCLAAVSLIGIASAAAVGYDRNGDNKINVWDLQLMVNEGASEEELEKALNVVLGLGELNPNEDGVYEIYTVRGLNQMAENADKGYSFKLMSDIDLKGAEWTPVEGFMGTFDGNGHTISNMKITEGIPTKTGTTYNMGMFADTVNKDNDTDRTVVKNLNLADVTIVLDNATEEASYYVGAIVGTNRGDVNNCTVTCAIYDQRTNLSKTNYIGSQVGRNDDTDDKNCLGMITATNALDTLEYYDYEPIYVAGYSVESNTYKGPEKVNSQMAMFFAELDAESQARVVGIAGYARSGSIPTDLLIQDTTNSSKYDDPELLARRTKVAEVMYEMCTVEWTPSTTLTYIKHTATKETKTYSQGAVIRGVPYNHGSSGMDRFLNYMEKNADGRWTTVSTLPEVAVYYSTTAGIDNINAQYDKYINATEAVKETLLDTYPELKYMTGKFVNTSQAGFNMYIGADCSSQASWAWRAVSASDTATDGFAAPTNTGNMFISQKYITERGLQPVNNFVFPKNVAENSATRSAYVKEYTRAHTAHYMETLSCVTKGDLLMDYTDEGGHTLVAMSDAVTILNYQGAVDLDKSYIITAEQGGSGTGTRKGVTADGKNWTSSCCVDRKNSFNMLYKEGTTDAYPGIFFPITCAALHQVDTPAAIATCSMSGGVVTSNFHIVSTTVGGETVYTKIAQSGHRDACTNLTVKTAHPNVKTGDKVQVKLSNGDVYTFTY